MRYGFHIREIQAGRVTGRCMLQHSTVTMEQGRRSMRKKKISERRLVCVMLAVLMLAGCGGKDTARESEKVTLSLMMPQSHYKEFFKEEIGRFEAEYSQYHIEVLRIPDNQWIEVTKAKAATGELTDLVRIDKGLMEDIGTGKFVEMGEKESWYKRVKEEQLENKKIGGKLYGLPVGSTSSVGLIYNKDVFERLRLDVPGSMEEFKQVCRILKEEGYTPLYASDKDSWTSAVAFSSSASQTMTDEVYEKFLSGEALWNNEEYRTILEEFAALRSEDYTNSDYMRATYDSAVDAVADGRAVMYMSGQFFINDVRKINPKIDLAMVPSPYCSGILTVKNGEGMFAVSAKSDHIEEAKVFLEWFSAPENMNEFNAGWNHMPVFKDQEMEMADWQQNLYDNYILPGKTEPEINERFSGIDMSEFWSDQQKMYMGQMSADEVLENWDQSYEKQLSAGR